MIHSLANVTFDSQVPNKDEQDLFLSSLVAGLRPGAGLIGNGAEEEALYKQGMIIQRITLATQDYVALYQ